jgi:hypothetical protein
MMDPRATRTLVCVALSLLAALALAACGGSPPTPPSSLPARSTPVAAVTFPADQEPHSGGTGGSTGGLEFVPWVDVEVSALGSYDHAQDGLRNDHKVVIYDSDKEAVTPTVVVSGASDLDGIFRYEPITPVVLKAGETYVLAFLGDMNGDYGTNFPEGVVWAPEIRFVRWKEHDRSWDYPDGTWHYLDVSANFKFLPVSTASPSP